MPATTADPGFDDILGLIAQARQQAVQTVNTVLIELYWRVGGIICQREASAPSCRS